MLNDGAVTRASKDVSGVGGESPSDEGSKPPTAPTSDAEKPDAAPPPGTDDKKPSRREQARTANEARIAELEAAVEAEKQAREDAIKQARDEARAEAERERAEAAEREQQESLSRKHLEDVERFQRLMRLPDADLSDDDYRWREEQKQLLAKYPEAERFHMALAQESVKTEREALEKDRIAFWDGVRDQLGAAAKLPHVDPKALLANAETPLDTWDKMAGYYHAAGAAWKDAEYAPKLSAAEEKIAHLEDEIKDLKVVGPRGLGSGRAPVTGGRSAASERDTSSFDPDRGWRQNLSAALSAPSNGRRG